MLFPLLLFIYLCFEHNLLFVDCNFVSLVTRSLSATTNPQDGRCIFYEVRSNLWMYSFSQSMSQEANAVVVPLAKICCEFEQNIILNVQFCKFPHVSAYVGLINFKFQ